MVVVVPSRVEPYEYLEVRSDPLEDSVEVGAAATVVVVPHVGSVEPPAMLSLAVAAVAAPMNGDGHWVGIACH